MRVNRDSDAVLIQFDRRLICFGFRSGEDNADERDTALRRQRQRDRLLPQVHPTGWDRRELHVNEKAVQRATTHNVKDGNESGIGGNRSLACSRQAKRARRPACPDASRFASFETLDDTVIVSSYLGEWSRVQRALLRMPSSQGEDTANKKAA
jgi:hypothetical protein